MPTRPGPLLATPSRTLTLDQARAVWWDHQGLSRTAPTGIASVLEASGWIRTLGGVDGYLSLRARLPELTAAGLRRALGAQEVQVVPAVRGCMYLLPRAHVPLLLRFADDQSRPRVDRDLVRVGAGRREVEEVGNAVQDVLRTGPRTTDELRRALPTGVVRPLGEAGRKAGLSSLLPVALRELEFRGRVERLAQGARLDTERYQWRLTDTSPFDGVAIPGDPSARLAAVAAIYFGQAGLATLADFAEWAGAGLRDAAAAVAELGLVPVRVEGLEHPHLAAPLAWTGLEAGSRPSFRPAFLVGEDNLFQFHGGPAPFADPRLHTLVVRVWGATRPAPLGTVRHLALRAVLDEGRLVALWEYDPGSGTVEVALLEPLPPARVSAIEAEAQATGAFLSQELGHGHSFSLDTDDDLRARAREIRDLAAAARG